MSQEYLLYKKNTFHKIEKLYKMHIVSEMNSQAFQSTQAYQGYQGSQPFQTFSRSFLQGIPDQRRQCHIDNIINGFIADLHAAASAGKTSYMYVPTILRQGAPVITNDDLVHAFQRKFPDCTISYEETWVNTDLYTKVLKKGIIIDWS